MKTVSIKAAKTQLSRFVDQAAAGEDIVLTKRGRPVFKLVPTPSDNQPTGPRRLGMSRGQIWESPDCWKRELEIEELFGN